MKTWNELTDHERIKRTASFSEIDFWLAALALIVAITALVLALT